MSSGAPPQATISSLPRRDRIAILTALGSTSAIAWAYLLWLAAPMVGMSAIGASMEIHRWTVGEFGMVFLMWAVMMVGMMVPTAMPATLVYAAVVGKAERQGATVASAVNFSAGYVVMWTLFSVAATAAQWGLDQAALLVIPNSDSTGPSASRYSRFALKHIPGVSILIQVTSYPTHSKS